MFFLSSVVPSLELKPHFSFDFRLAVELVKILTRCLRLMEDVLAFCIRRINVTKMSKYADRSECAGVRLDVCLAGIRLLFRFVSRKKCHLLIKLIE